MRGFLIGAVLTLGLSVASAAPHRPRVYPNASLTIFAIAEGPDGLLWLASPDGLYRFDGFHYHKITSYPFASARFIGFTRDGSLWAGGLEGLARAAGNRFEILRKDEVLGLAAYPDQMIVAGIQSLARIRLDGSVSSLPRLATRDLTVDSTGRLWFTCLREDRACWIEPNEAGPTQDVAMPPGHHQVVRDSQGRMWAAHGERAVLLDNGRVVRQLERQRSHEPRRAGPLLAGRNGQLWFLGETIRGLTAPIDFSDRKDNDRYPPISGREDRRGHLWLGSLGQGLVEWAAAPAWQRWFPEDFGNAAAAQVVRERKGAAVVATHNNLYRQDAQGRWSPLIKEERRFAAIYPLPEGGFLASIREFGLARISAEGKVEEHAQDVAPVTDDYREIVRDGKGRIWIGAKRGLFRIDGDAGRGPLRLRREQLPGLAEGEAAQAVDLEIDDAGRLWAGYASGIAWLDDADRWRQITADEPVTMVRSFGVAGDDIWVAYRRAGSFSRLRRKGDRWFATHYPVQAGYGPVDTHFLKRDSRGWIWRGSPEGVHISDGRHLAPNDWIHIHAGNGLASNQTDQYGFFEDTDGSVWIAGADGVSHLRPDATWFDAPRSAPAPQITRIEADGRVFLYPEPLPAALPVATRILRVDVGSLEAPPFRDDPLRYRLLPVSREWQLSRDGTLEFRNLAENAYSLEVGYVGNGLSAVATYPFRVGAGGSMLSWRWVIGVLALVGALVPLVRRAPWLDRINFRISKALFLLKRRYRHGSYDSGAGAAADAPDYSGVTFCERYQLGRIVSRGGFSVVYEARDLHDGGARLAVKVLNRSSNESWVRDRFAHEVAALRSVEHPGVIRILDSWISPAGEPCLAMPFLDGQTLRAALDQIPFSLPRTARIVSQLGAALSEVHSRGIVHRDLKPENLMLRWPGTEREQPVIIDFGTAGLRSAENELAATTLMAGSFHYMAPERLTGHYSPSSDVFSLGVIMLEMLTGKRLADLNAMFSDQSFGADLEKALRGNLGDVAAKAVAERLAPSYDPEPRRRPAAVKVWAEQVAAALDPS